MKASECFTQEEIDKIYEICEMFDAKEMYVDGKRADCPRRKVYQAVDNGRNPGSVSE